MTEGKYKVILFYLYNHMSKETVDMLKEREQAVCEVLNLTGRIILAKEGINGTLEGTPENIEIFKKHLKSTKYFKKITFKESYSEGGSFPKLKVMIKPEIVSTHLPKRIDPTVKTGKHINPVEMKRLYEKGEEFYVVDMRSDYEVNVGHFKNTVNVDWQMPASRELPKFVKKLGDYKNKKIVTVCTGGIKCEKMSAYLLDQGFKDVYQLHNGIHAYMQKYPGQDFKGTLYTFDNRMTMDFGNRNKEDIVGKCYSCQKPCEKIGHCSFSLCHKHLIVCENCEKNQIYCDNKCNSDDDTMKARLQKYMHENLIEEGK
jgi:UPF0176 protein